MRGAIEFEKLFNERTKKWKVEIEKQKAAYKKEHPYLTEERLESIFKTRLEEQKESLIGIWDNNHPSHDGFKKNNFLAEVFARLESAPAAYRISPFGNFFSLEYPSLMEEHLQLEKSHTDWYAYHNGAFEWDLNTIIDYCAQNHLLSSLLRPQEKEQPRINDLKTTLAEKTGVMNSTQLAKYVSKSPSTITRWLNETDIPHTRFQGRASFKKDEIEAWLERGSRKKK